MKKLKEVIGSFTAQELQNVVIPRIKHMDVYSALEVIKAFMLSNCEKEAQQFAQGDFSIMKSTDGITWAVIRGSRDDPDYNDKIANINVVKCEKAMGVFTSQELGTILKMTLEDDSALYYTYGGDGSVLTTSLEEVFLKPIENFK